jgi:hypothetical protein
MRVCHGPGWLRRLLLVAVRAPARSAAIPVRLVVLRRGLVECWQRTFGAQRLVTTQMPAPGGLLSERAGPLEIRFRLVATDGTLLYRQESLAVSVGRLRLPVPRWLALQVTSREAPTGQPNQTSLVVEIADPRGGLLFSYAGSVRWGGVPVGGAPG